MKPQQIIKFGYFQEKGKLLQFPPVGHVRVQTDADAARCWKSKVHFLGAECYGKTSDSGKTVPETTWSCESLNQQLAVYDGNAFTLHETTRNQIIISGLTKGCLAHMHYLDKHKFISFCRNPFLCNPLRRNDTVFFVNFWWKSVETEYHDMFLPVRFLKGVSSNHQQVV